MKRFRILCVAVLALILCAGRTFGCFTTVVGKKVSPTGSVIVGHNEDDGGRLVVRHGYVPPASHAEDETLPAETGRAAIPQVARTAGFYWSQVKGAEGGLSNADAMLNDYGVVVVSNSCASSRENTRDDSRLTEGGIEYNLRRVVAERATSAREGVKIAIDMLRHYGYAPSGRTYTIADKDEGWMVQVVSGKHYAAVKVPDDEVACIPNHYTVHSVSFDDPEMIVPEDLIAYAQSKGWYDPNQGPFDFAKAYQAEKSYMQDYNVLRQRAAFSIILDRPFTDEVLPFSVKPNGMVSAEKIKAILRTHYEGTPYDAPWHRARFPGAAPHDTTVRRVCTGSTVESTLWVLADRPELTTMWVAFGRPCTLPYIPLHPLVGLPRKIGLLDNPAAALKEHLEPDRYCVAWCDDGWQKLRDFQSLFELLYEENFKTHRSRLWNMEHFMSLRNDELVAKATALFAEKKDDEAQELLAMRDAAEVDQVLKTLDEVFDSLHPIPVEIEADALDKAFDGQTVTLSFHLDMNRVPVEETLLFGLGFCNARTQWAAAVDGSLHERGRGWWSFEVKADHLLKTLDDAAGQFECWVGGRDRLNRPFGGCCFVENR